MKMQKGNKIDENSSFSPVILPESPAVSSPQKNLTGLPRVARDIAADFYNNIQHWNTLHIKGAALVNEIAGHKSNSNKLYPDGLEKLNFQLTEVNEGLKRVTNSLLLSAQQIDSLKKLHKSPIPLFISWSIEKMSKIGMTIAKAYAQELKLKQFVSENISHLQDKDKIMFYSACWVHQPYITIEVNLCLESLLTETGHRMRK